MGATSSRGGKHAMAGQSPAPLQGRRAGPEVKARLSQGCRPSGKEVHGDEAGPKPSWEMNPPVRVRSSDCWAGPWQRLKTQD